MRFRSSCPGRHYNRADLKSSVIVVSRNSPESDRGRQAGRAVAIQLNYADDSSRTLMRRQSGRARQADDRRPGHAADASDDVPAGLKVFDATEIENLRAIGASNMCFHGDSAVSQMWADAVWSHPVGVDGILYRSDKNRNKCVAIFHRATQRCLGSITAEARGHLGHDGVFLSALRRGGFFALRTNRVPALCY